MPSLPDALVPAHMGGHPSIHLGRAPAVVGPSCAPALPASWALARGLYCGCEGRGKGTRNFLSYYICFTVTLAFGFSYLSIYHRVPLGSLVRATTTPFSALVRMEMWFGWRCVCGGVVGYDLHSCFDGVGPAGFVSGLPLLTSDRQTSVNVRVGLPQVFVGTMLVLAL